MNDLGGALVPFLRDSNTYPPALLYEDDEFLVASGEDKDYPNHISIGVRWRSSRNEKGKPNPLGFPLTRGTIRCWLIMQDSLALCLLNHIKDKVTNDKKDKICDDIKALQNKINDKKEKK